MKPHYLEHQAWSLALNEKSSYSCTLFSHWPWGLRQNLPSIDREDSLNTILAKGSVHFQVKFGIIGKPDFVLFGTK
jgi:hypothetical protein